MIEDTPWIVPALVLAGSYLLGSVPFGLVVTRLAGAGDIRSIGSGNIGATNVLRTGRRGLAALTLVLDALKGAAPVLVAVAIASPLGPIAATGAFLGHCYPIWLRFRGGKGVATLLGIALALSWPAGLIFMAVWLLALALTGYSSIGGMGAAMSVPVSSAFFGRFDLVILFLALALIVLWKHRGNLERLMAGTEPKVRRAGA